MNASVIFLQAIGPVDAQVMAYLKDSLSCFWSVEILPGIEVPQEAYHEARKQYEGSALLGALSDRETPVLGVTEVDAFVDGLNYLFGMAIGRRAIISLKRLRPESYGLAENDELLKQRVQKEAIHELGHVFGLNHCLTKTALCISPIQFWILISRIGDTAADANGKLCDNRLLARINAAVPISNLKY